MVQKQHKHIENNFVRGLKMGLWRPWQKFSRLCSHLCSFPTTRDLFSLFVCFFLFSHSILVPSDPCFFYSSFWSTTSPPPPPLSLSLILYVSPSSSLSSSVRLCLCLSLYLTLTEQYLLSETAMGELQTCFWKMPLMFKLSFNFHFKALIKLKMLSINIIIW